jgi:hypothetical protein
VVGGGYGVVPALRRVETQALLPDGTPQTTVASRTASRWTVFVAVDATLYSF